MSVIVDLRVDGADFELGRVLDPPSGARVALRRPLPEDDRVVPFWVDGSDDGLVATVEHRDGVEAVRPVDSFADRTLYALEWQPDGERLLAAADEAGGNLLACRGDGEGWTVQLRFPDESALAAFDDWCSDNGVAVDVEDRYCPLHPSRYGLTDRQRHTLRRAVESGYYDIPRTTTTQELADELGVSDQAVTERLRRAITSLVESTLLAEE